jgi:hypothetical protein
MSLSEAVLEIADSIEAVSKENRSIHPGELKGIASQLRLIVKASACVMPVHATNVDERVFMGGSVGFKNTHPHVSDAMKLEEVQRKQLLKQGEHEEMISGGMVECVGGIEDGTMVPVPDSIPDQAKTLMSGQVYVFLHKDRKFHYSEEETAKLQKSR